VKTGIQRQRPAKARDRVLVPSLFLTDKSQIEVCFRKRRRLLHNGRKTDASFFETTLLHGLRGSLEDFGLFWGLG
jgi:hypothetical protein